MSFSVEKGEIVGILGPNGSGKSTLFKIITTLIPPESGSVKICGIKISEQPDRARRFIGVIFQNPSLDKKLTVHENLESQARLYGLKPNFFKEKISRELNRYGLQERYNDLVETLSGGLKRRVEIIKGLLHLPTLLLLDEPSTGLDPRSRKEMWEHLKQLKKEGITVLLTTHLIEEAEKCDRLILINEGAIVATGSPNTIKQEMAGEVIVIETKDPQAFISKLEGFPFGKSPKTILANTVRIETEKAHSFIPQMMDQLGEEILSVTVGKPTLEDLFIHKTGHKFE